MRFAIQGELLLGSPPVMVCDPVMRYPVKIGFQVLARSIAFLQGFQQAAESLCHAFLRQIFVPQQAPGVPVQAWTVGIVEFAQGALLEALQTLQKHLFIFHHYIL